MGCKKDEPVLDEPSDPYYGEATALMNGEAMDFECSTLLSPDYEDKVALALYHFNDAGYARGSFNFRYFPYIVGSYSPVTRELEYVYGTPRDSLFTVSYFSLQSDGDVMGDRYVLKNGSSAIFTVDNIKKSTNEIWGTFEIEMVKDTSLFGELDKNAPYEISFKSGEFYAIVRE